MTDESYTPFQLLKTDRQVATICVLALHPVGSHVDATRVTKFVYGITEDVDPFEIESYEYRSTREMIVHHDLPKLEAMDVAVYDDRLGAIVPTERVHRLAALAMEGLTLL